MWHICTNMGAAMRSMFLPKTSDGGSRDNLPGPLDLELMDVYVAIFIAVPVVLFLKSLWL